MTPTEIREAVAADPALSALAQSGSFDALAAALSAQAEPEHVEVPAVRAAKYFIKRSKWRAFVAAADAGNVAAQAAVDVATLPGMTVDFADTDPATLGMWAALIKAGLCTEAERDVIRGWCLVPVVLTHLQVAEALKGN